MTTPHYHPQPKVKGFMLIAIGAALLLHTLGLFQHMLSGLIVIGALCMIAYGMVLTHLHTKIMELYHAYISKK